MAPDFALSPAFKVYSADALVYPRHCNGPGARFMSNHSLTLPDFARLLGHPEQALPSACRDTIVMNNWQYGWIEGEALDELVAGLLDRIRRRDFSIAIPGDKTRWVKGWGENLDEFVASKGDLSALAPKYVRADLPVRLFRRFAQTAEPQFELNWRRVYQQYLFSTYLADCERIYEFGCGSGGHVSVLAQMFPKKKIVGLDWAEPSCEIVNNMHRLHGWNTEGRLFDFYKPDYSIDIPADSVVMTFAALEQISDSFGAFLDFLLAKRPKLCVFVEPIREWYDGANFIDHLAIRGHDIRNFLKGMPGTLHRLQGQGRIEIIKEHRVEFGSLLHEAYSQMIWRPL
jgi:hypothetical protein